MFKIAIAPEYIKHSRNSFREELLKLIQQIWQGGQIPIDWTENIIVPIHKKGNTLDCNNYRAICLTSVGLKLYTRILEQKLRKYTEKTMQEEQAAFRAQRQTQDHICTLRTIINKTLSTNRELYIAFMDISAAFHDINRTDIWQILKTRKIPEQLQLAIENVYKNVLGRVRLNGAESETFDWVKGLKQGDSLSPLLFNLVMDQVTKDCNNKLRSKKTKIGYWNLQPIYVQALTYADDVVLIADSKEKLQEIVTTWVENLKLRNLDINANKSKVLYITKKKEEETGNPKITVGTDELEAVNQFKYLGTMFSRNGKIGTEIKNRISQATRTYYQLNKTVINKKELGVKTKMQIYQTVYLPTLLYGCVTWDRTTKTDSQVTAAEMKYLRPVLNKTRKDRERNVKIRETLKVRPVTQLIEEKQLKWFGHVKRMGKDRIVRKSVEAREWEKRSRGRPRITWLDNIKEYGRKRGKTLPELEKITKDRKAWKELSEEARH